MNDPSDTRDNAAPPETEQTEPNAEDILADLAERAEQEQVGDDPSDTREQPEPEPETENDGGGGSIALEFAEPQSDVPDPEGPSVGAPPIVYTDPKEERKPYWVGTMPKCPLWNQCVGGISFPRSHAPMTNRGKQRGPPGQIVMLSDRQVSHVLSEVQRRVVRRVGKGYRVLEVMFPPDIDATGKHAEPWPNPRYRAEERDKPLGCYLYMHPCNPKNPQARPLPDPKPLYRGEE